MYNYIKENVVFSDTCSTKRRPRPLWYASASVVPLLRGEWLTRLCRYAYILQGVTHFASCRSNAPLIACLQSWEKTGSGTSVALILLGACIRIFTCFMKSGFFLFRHRLLWMQLVRADVIRYRLTTWCELHSGATFRSNVVYHGKLF